MDIHRLDHRRSRISIFPCCMPYKSVKEIFWGLLVWMNESIHFFVHLFTTVVSATATAAAFFSHWAIIDVYFHWNKEGIVDGISYFHLLSLVPFNPPFHSIHFHFPLFATFDKRTAFNHSLYKRGPRWCKQFRNIAYCYMYTKMCDTLHRNTMFYSSGTCFKSRIVWKLWHIF